jgi:chromosome segregation ATPase
MADKPELTRIGGAATEDKDLAQIREILFGEHSRRIAERLALLDARLDGQESDLRRALEEQLRAFERAAADLEARLNAQEARQQAALDGLETLLRGLLDQAGDRLTRLDSDLQDASHRLMQSLEQQAAEHARLQQASVGRAQLAALLEGLARQLRDQDHAR